MTWRKERDHPVVIPAKAKSSARSAEPGQATPERPASPPKPQPPKPARIDGTVLRLSTDELVRLAPRLRGYLATPAPTWPDVVDAADWLRGELGVSKPLWGEACLRQSGEPSRQTGSPLSRG